MKKYISSIVELRNKLGIESHWAVFVVFAFFVTSGLIAVLIVAVKN
jgi:hypothetical protein